MSLLLKAGAPVNCRVTEDSSTPLHKACAGGKPGHLSAVRQLIDAGADVHALNKWRETPLLTAANHGNAGAVELLLKAGADPCKCTDTGWSPLSIAAYKGHDDVVRLLLEEGAPTEEADPSLSALLQAATKGLPDTVELLLRHGADHTVTTKKGDTALSILVEQNLIDAAVEMVTEYKASVPRCSRDRKKVQRARLLINLRMKQLQREGLLTGSTDDEDETDDENSDKAKSALHDENSEFADCTTVDAVAQASERKKKKKKTANKSAEEQARAAEEALLLELQQEDEKAKKEEADANSKREKKRKKKERERLLKMKEEEEKREQEEREAKERERQQREREEQQRKEQEHREQEARERKMKEAEEFERQVSLKQKEKEARERRQRNLEVKEREKTTTKKGSPCESPASSISSDRRNRFSTKGPKKKQVCAVADTKSHDSHSADSNSSSQSSGSPAPSQPGRTRAWETPGTPETHEVFSYAQVLNPIHKLPRSSDAASRTGKDTITLSPRPSVVVDSYRICSVSSEFHGITPKNSVAVTGGRTRSNVVHAPVTSEINDFAARSISPLADNLGFVEHPAIGLFRQEKLTDLFKTCADARASSTTDPLRILEESTIKKVFYRWIVRAAHGQAPLLDSIIPSWVDSDSLKAFFQRQFIAESRAGSRLSNIGAGMLNIEALKDAGSAMAALCHKIVKDITQLRSKLDEELRNNWSDSLLGVTATNDVTNGSAAVVVDWAGKSQVCIPTQVFTKLQERYTGPPGKFLSAVLACRKRYEIRRIVCPDEATDSRLTEKTQACLARNAQVSVELWTDPSAVYGNNIFTGNFFDVDALFGGLKPFAKEDGGGEELMATQGGSASVLLPLDTMIAARYVRSVIDLLEAGETSGVPLSFAVFAPKDCFGDLKRAPNVSDLNLMDSRLGDNQSVYLRCDATLHPGQHVFQSFDVGGFEHVSPDATLLVVLQNSAGTSRYPFDGSVMTKIIKSMSSKTESAEVTEVDAYVFSDDFDVKDSTTFHPASYFDSHSIPMSPEPQKSSSKSAAAFGAIGGVVISNPFSPTESRRGRHGRLFELIDDGEDDTANDADVVSGMLNNLNGLFHNNLSQDVDIEAISLMGIGGNPMGLDPALPSFSSSRSSRMFG